MISHSKLESILRRLVNAHGGEAGYIAIYGPVEGPALHAADLKRMALLMDGPQSRPHLPEDN